VALHPAAGVEQERDEAFNVRVEERMPGDVDPPILLDLLRGGEFAQFDGGRTLPKGNNLPLMGVEREKVRFNDRRFHDVAFSCAPKARRPGKRAVLGRRAQRAAGPRKRDQSA
jgi:hypothetical protein